MAKGRRGENLRAGRPMYGSSPPDRAFTDPATLEQEISAYFEELEEWGEEVEIRHEHGKEIRIVRPVCVHRRPPTVAGLAYHLGVSRTTLWLYRKQAKEGDPFEPVLARALARIAAWTEEALYNRDFVQGARFALEVNHGYGKEEADRSGATFRQEVIAPAAPEHGRAIPKWGGDE